MRRIKLQETINDNIIDKTNHNEQLKPYIDTFNNKSFLCIALHSKSVISIQRYTSFTGELLYNIKPIIEQNIAMCELPDDSQVYLQIVWCKHTLTNISTFLKIVSDLKELHKIYHLCKKISSKINIFNVNTNTKMHDGIQLQNINNIFIISNMDNIQLLSDSQVYLMQKLEVITEANNFYFNDKNEVCINVNLLKYYNDEPCTLYFQLYYMNKNSIIQVKMAYSIEIFVNSFFNLLWHKK